MKENQLTPLQQLIADQQALRVRSKIEEVKIEEDFKYLTSNAGSILFTEVKDLIFNRKKSTKKANAFSLMNGFKKKSHEHNDIWSALSVVVPHYLGIATEIVSVVWVATRPFKMARNLFRQIGRIF